MWFIDNVQFTYTFFLYKKYNYNTIVFNWIYIFVFRSIISELQLSESTESLAAVAVFILSHGEDNGTVFAADAMYRVDNDILFMLTADKCPYLAGKPKLIFVQACQGQVIPLMFTFFLKRDLIFNDNKSNLT